MRRITNHYSVVFKKYNFTWGINGEGDPLHLCRIFLNPYYYPRYL